MSLSAVLVFPHDPVTAVRKTEARLAVMIDAHIRTPVGAQPPKTKCSFVLIRTPVHNAGLLARADTLRPVRLRRPCMREIGSEFGTNWCGEGLPW
eukprot:4804014-Alexandrium_andersonii.AAC.1